MLSVGLLVPTRRHLFLSICYIFFRWCTLVLITVLAFIAGTFETGWCVSLEENKHLNDAENEFDFVFYRPFYWELHSTLFSKLKAVSVLNEGWRSKTELAIHTQCETLKLASCLEKACEMRGRKSFIRINCRPVVVLLGVQLIWNFSTWICHMAQK